MDQQDFLNGIEPEEDEPEEAAAPEPEAEAEPTGEEEPYYQEPITGEDGEENADAS